VTAESTPTGAEKNSEGPDRLYMSEVLADIESEVRSKRASGELPEDFERQLDIAFARLAPVDSVSGDFHTLLAKLEESTTIDTRAPTASTKRGVSQLKSVVARAIDWELRHLAGQVTGVTHALTRALGMLGSRVEDLERDSAANADSWLLELDSGHTRAALPDGDWAAIAKEAVGNAGDGRILHGECGSGALVGELQQVGLHAYGVDPDERLVRGAPPEVVDLRREGVREHLRALPARSLAGVILSGCVDRYGPGATLELAELAARRLGPEGRLVVISHLPGSWPRPGQELLADLSTGWPFHPATWLAVLSKLGFDDLHRRDPAAGDGATGYAIVATRR
jgi:SAM-dependent methyltransferase